MLRNWRAWVLIVLLVGPILAYLGFGALWLMSKGWLLYASAIWIASGIVFAILASRWTTAKQPLLPPLDWDAPHTFTAFDRRAWEHVEKEADQGDVLDLESLSGVDVYIDTGRRLARVLAQHYHPLAADPIERVPVVEFLTALELAAEDLNGLCRQVPGGDLITAAHWKQAVQMAGYLQKANDIYSYILPIFNPVTGLARLGAQHWMVKPAWRSMQQNLLRWFFRAYVNRLGIHLVELYSGRLVIGTDQYRKLVRKPGNATAAIDAEVAAPVVAIAGARESGKSRLIEALEQGRSGDAAMIKARLQAVGFDLAQVERLKEVRFVEVPGYSSHPGGETARDRTTRREAVEQAVEADLLILVVDGRKDTAFADVAFATAWDKWFVEHPRLEASPAMAVVTGADRLEFGENWAPPYNWDKGQTPRETAVRARMVALRTSLPPTIHDVVAVGLPKDGSFGIVEELLPTLVSLLHRAERAALLRHLHQVSNQSKARRLVKQVGQQGRQLWKNLRSGRGARAANADSPTTPHA